MLAVQTIGNRYHVLDKLGEGGMGAVYRANDRLTGQNVALKQVVLNYSPPVGHVSDFRYALAQEFKVLSSLRHPHIISVLDYGFAHDGEPYFTLELLENAQSLVDYGRHQPLAKQVDFLIQMLQALVYLHQRDIIHRDIKPENVMIVNDQVKVLDFGLAIAREHLNPETGPAGTLPYMSPEIFSGTPVSVASDLYAVGIMIYEMLTGDVPFHSTDNKYALMYKIARTPPDDAPLLNSPLRDVIMRLLQKRPEDRYTSASEVISALCAATGYPRPPESIAVRESFLQAARFVGREVEFGILRDALTEAQAGHGSAWLVGGESGVGKSRLLDELRIQALVDGALVLRGQAIAEGGLPYQIWRSAVRRLSLQTDLTDFAAAVLKPLVPDIERLLAREVADTPQIDAQSLQLRLFSVIESMFRQQHQQLVVLLLEDLHWADDSLILLKRLNNLVSELPLLIVATYRDDERPTLRSELPALRHIRLERLSPASIEMLSESMLGEIGKSENVVDLLTRETEGNVFFIVEVVRALAEDAGQRADIGRKTLPEHVFAGGIRTVIQRRLDKVPVPARRLMTMAAVAGRQLDLKMLHVLVPTLNLDDWLQQVATVIEVRGSHYRFAHDKLRDGILLALEPDDRRGIHREIAQAIESAYPESPEQYAALTYHWGQAGDAAKTIHNATLAGEQALHSGSYREAIQFFDQALTLTDQIRLATQQLSNLHSLIGYAQWGQSDMSRSRQAHIKALDLLGISVPQTPKQLALGSLKPLMSHLRRRVFRIQRPTNNPQDWLIAAKSLHQITQGSYHDANFILGLHCLLKGVDAAERAGDNADALQLQALYYNSMSFAAGDIGIYPIARFYRRLVEKYLEREPAPEIRAWSGFIQGMYFAGRGQWETCDRLMDEAQVLIQSVGNLGLWVEISEFKEFSLILQSRFADALSAVETTIQIARRDERFQIMSQMYISKARLLLLQGKTDEARKQYFDNEAFITTILQQGHQTVGRIAATGFLIDLHICAEAWDEALKLAETLNDLVASAQTISFILAREASASIGLYLTLWEKHSNPSYKRLAQSMLGLFHRKYTRRYEIGHPVEQMYRCWYHWLSGNEKAARNAGILAIQSAQTYQMPYYEAAAHYHLARFMKADSPERARHIQTAVNLFREVGAASDVERILQSEPLIHPVK